MSGQGRKRRLRPRRPVEGGRARRRDRAVAGENRLRLRQIARLLVARLDRAPPEGALGRVGGGDGADHRQGELALAEVVADVLARRGRIARIVEHVVGHLEGDPERVAIGAQRRDLRLGRARDHAPHLGRGGEQRRRLAAHDAQIDLFGRGEVLRRRQLQHLALGDGGRGIREDREHPGRARLGHELEGAGKEIVAHKHARLVVPEQVRRRTAAAGAAFVHHIVVQERRGMDELDRGGEADVMVAPIAAEPRRRERQDRPHPLAARPHQMRRHLGDAGGVLGRHARPDRGIDRREIVREMRRQPVERSVHLGVHRGPLPSTSRVAPG